MSRMTLFFKTFERAKKRAHRKNQDFLTRRKELSSKNLNSDVSRGLLQTVNFLKRKSNFWSKKVTMIQKKKQNLRAQTSGCMVLKSDLGFQCKRRQTGNRRVWRKDFRKFKTFIGGLFIRWRLKNLDILEINIAKLFMKCVCVCSLSRLNVQITKFLQVNLLVKFARRRQKFWLNHY